MKALWNALKDTSATVEAIMAIVTDPSCGLERRSSEADGLMLGREGTYLWIEGDCTPLMLAALACRVDVMKALLDMGADMGGTECGSQSQTPLHIAAKSGCVEGLNLLLAYGAEVDIRRLEYGGMTGITPLMDAAKSGEDDCVTLIANGADVGATDRIGGSALHYAAQSRRSTDMSKLLLAEGANVYAKDKHNRTPLHEAAERGFYVSIEEKLATIELYIKSGLDINAVDTDGDTVLHTFAGKEPFTLSQVLDLLVAKGADVNAVNTNGCTPLRIAATYECVEGIKALVSNGALVNFKDQKGCTPLHIVSFSSSNRDKRNLLAEALLECGADVNTVDEDQATPLHHACARGQFKVAKLLILKGAMVQALDKSGNTPLHFAAERFWENNLNEFISMLISQGADVNASNRSGTTPLHSAIRSPACIKLLIAKGADVNAEDKKGYSPLHYARQLINADSAKLLSAVARPTSKGLRKETPRSD